MFEIATSEHVEFWEYLKKRNKKDHKLMELWILLKEPNSWRSQMERPDLVFTKVWVSEVRNGVTEKSKVVKLDALFNQSEKEVKDDAKPPRVAESIREELVKQVLEPALQSLYDKWDKQQEAESEAEKARKLEEAKKALAPARDKARLAIRGAGEGLLWHVAEALDGQPYTVVTTSFGRRPAPALVKLGQPPEGSKAPKRTLSARWRWYEDKFCIEVIDGDATLIPSVGTSLKVTARQAGIQAEPKGGPQKIFDHLFRMSLVHSMGSSGYFWFVEDIPGKGPVVIMRAGREAEMERMLAGMTFAQGEWKRERLRARITFELSAGADERTGRAMAVLLRRRVIHRLERVEVKGMGFHLLDDRWPAGKQAVQKEDQAWKARLRRIEQENKRLAKAPSGRLWFTHVDRTEKPLVVLYKELTPVFDKKSLVSQKGPPVPGTGGTWARDNDRKVIVVTLLGSGNHVLLGEMLRKHLVAARIFPETRFEVSGAGGGRARSNAITSR